MFKSLFGPPDVEALRATGDYLALIKASCWKRRSTKAEDILIRQSAVTALSELAEGEVATAVPFRHVANALLSAATEDTSSAVRQFALRALTRVGHRADISLLLPAIDNGSLPSELGVTLLKTVGQTWSEDYMHTQSLRKQCISALFDPRLESGARAGIALALGTEKIPEASEILTLVLQTNADHLVRIAAAWALKMQS